MADVRLEEITQQFGNAVVVENISFHIPDGQFWVLVGPSGCGKSTILRSIAGLTPITSGNLYIGDRRVNGIPARQRDVAMVFQNYALYPHMTVADNLAFGLRMRQTDAPTIRARVETVARMLDISHLLDRQPRQLSGGQQQRVALGRAIARQPQVFLLDEPLSNLDAQLRDDTRAELKQLHQRVGITTIYVTHDQVEAMTLADQIVVLHQGQIQQIDTPQGVYQRPANRMVATFLGNPPMNMLAATYDGNSFQIDGQSLPCSDRLRHQLHPFQGQRFDLGIRPEQLRPCTDEGHLHGIVSVVEPLGREILVRVTLSTPAPLTQQVVNLPVAPTYKLQPGDLLNLHVNLETLFVFEPISGKVLYTPA